MSNYQQDYVQQLENTLRQFLKPLDNIPFRVLIPAICGHRVLAFDPADKKDKTLLRDLKTAAAIAAKTAYQTGIFTKRANEVGNRIEPFVLDALNKTGLIAHTPKTASGKRKSAGYPDIYFQDRFERPNYLECKTYNRQNQNSALRAFYLSPPRQPSEFKIAYDARHFILAFEIERAERNNKTVFVPMGWKLYSAEKLCGQIKVEFNASNAQMYGLEVLAEGTVNHQ